MPFYLRVVLRNIIWYLFNSILSTTITKYIRTQRRMKVNNVPYACGLVTKSKCIAKAFAEMKTSEPISVLSCCSNWTSWGLNKLTARWSSVAHSPLRLCIANSAGTQPNGPVPVTRTRRAPNSYRCCIHHAFISLLQHLFKEKKKKSDKAGNFCNKYHKNHVKDELWPPHFVCL